MLTNIVEFEKKVREDPTSIWEILKTLKTEGINYEDRFLDRLLGLPVFTYDREPDPNKRFNHYQDEQGVYLGTPYKVIDQILKTVKPTKEQVFYDLGCGYGRVVLYGALTNDATFKGIELLPHRIETANSIKTRFDIRNAYFTRGNILDQDFSDGNIFYIFRAFTAPTLNQVYEKLHAVSLMRKITVATLSMNDLNTPSWLKEVTGEGSGNLAIYDSLPNIY